MFCKIQLVELEQRLASIREQGQGVAAISYDSVAVLKNFADRKHITFPLLSDPDSKIIRSFGIFNESVPANSQAYGTPYLGSYIVGPSGTVLAKYFEGVNNEHSTIVEILERPGGGIGVAHTTMEAKQLRVSSSASPDLVRQKGQVALFLDIDLPPKMHVYAPGVQGYIAIDWKMADTAGKFSAARFPAPEMLHLDVIKETVPVYRGHFQLEQDVVFGAEDQVKPLLNEHGELSLEGSFHYQACDDHECYIPETVPLKWTLQFEQLDHERVPGELQRKPRS